jgi:hypothetical protein
MVISSVDDELAWVQIKLLISADWVCSCTALPGVLGFQGVVSRGHGVRGLISSFDSTTSGSRGIKAVALDLDWIFVDEKG